MCCGDRISAARSGAGAYTADRDVAYFSNVRRSLERRIDRREFAFEISAGAVDHGDDRKRNAGCDEAIFDGRCARLVGKETFDQRHGPGR